MNNTWISSDWHLGHKNLVRGSTEWEGEERIGDCRNFDSLEEHDETILNNINNNIKENDTIYFLGDFALGGRENIYKYWLRIKCKNIHFIGGNHDIHINKNSIIQTNEGEIPCQDLFSSYNQLLKTKIRKKSVVLCHYPVVIRHKPFEYPIILYGHFHGTLKEGYCNNSPSMDVGIDTHPEFRPYHIDEILKQIK